MSLDEAVAEALALRSEIERVSGELSRLADKRRSAVQEAVDAVGATKTAALLGVSRGMVYKILGRNRPVNYVARIRHAQSPEAVMRLLDKGMKAGAPGGARPEPVGFTEKSVRSNYKLAVEAWKEGRREPWVGRYLRVGFAYGIASRKQMAEELGVDSLELKDVLGDTRPRKVAS